MKSYNDCEKRIPLIGNLEITYKCPYSCGYCYNNRTSQKELTTEQIIHLIDEVFDAGCLHLCISGGEPLIHKDFAEIYEYIIKKGIRISLETTAACLTEEILDLFIKYPPSQIFVTILGVNNEIHQKVSNSGIHISVIQNNVMRLVQNNLKVGIRTPISRDNYMELHLIKQFCDILNLRYRPTTKIWWNQSGERKYLYRSNSKTLKEFIPLDPIYEKVFNNYLKIEESKSDGNYKDVSCKWGKHEFYINAYGEMYHCFIFWQNKYDLLNGSFKDAWENWYPKYLKDQLCRKVYPTNGKCPGPLLYWDVSIETSKTLEEIIADNA